MPTTYRPLFIIPELTVEMNAGGIQAKRFIDAIVKNGINPLIYAKKTDYGISQMENYDVRLVYDIPHKNFSAIARRLFPDLVLHPDIEKYTFLPFLKSELRNIKNYTDFDWIHTISNPCSSHLAGLALKKKTKLPWVAQFYDPWVGNCYREFKTSTFSKFDAKTEYKIALNADVIIHTNEVIKDKWIKRYGDIVRDKIVVLPFCYDENIEIKDYNGFDINRTAGKKISILYVGNLYLNRNIDDLILAINELKTTIPDLEDKIVFRFVGIVSRHDIENIKKNKLDNMFELIGQRPYDQLVEYYEDADVLLVIDAPAKENIFFPSKLIEYFVYKKPLLGISPKISETHNLLVESGHTAIENGSIRKIVDYLSSLLINEGDSIKFNSDYYMKFSPDLVAKQYIELIESKILNIK
jgi:glycosyltransferase involved in cell wall biosynthesis